MLSNTNDRLKYINKIIYVEGSYELPPIQNSTVIRINDTRRLSPDIFAENLQIIDLDTYDSYELWISDLMWPMNNAIYSKLCYMDKLRSIVFFDEGLVLYLSEKLNYSRMFREFLKFKILSIKFSSKFTTPERYPFLSKKDNAQIFSLHPVLMNEKRNVTKLSIDYSLVKSFDQWLDGNATQDWVYLNTTIQHNILFLSQPYHRVTDPSSYHKLLIKLKVYLERFNAKNYYIKLHPSETDDDYSQYYQHLGFQRVFNNLKVPIEAKLSCLPAKTILCSFNSSALLNARLFGFTGELVSFGNDWIIERYLLQKKSLIKVVRLFESSGVNVVSTRDM